MALAYAKTLAVPWGWREPAVRRTRAAAYSHRVVVATCLLAAADALTTVTGLRIGCFHEVNPILSLALIGGVPTFLFVKCLLTALWASIAWFVRRPWFVGVNEAIMGVYSLVVLRSTVHLLSGAF